MKTRRKTSLGIPGLLEAKQLTYSINGRTIIDNLSMKLQSGSFLGIIGPNGSGKSTLLRMLCGLLKPVQGSLTLEGKPFKAYSTKERAQMIGYVPQDCSLDADFTIEQIVAMGRHPYSRLLGGLTSSDAQQVERAMEQCGVDHLRDRYIHACSGGQRQLAFIAKALAQEPQILLLDEPISALDIRHQLRTLALLRQLADEGYAVVASLHDLSLASRYCDRLLLLHDGRIEAFGEPEEVLSADALYDVYGVHAVIRHEPGTEGLSIIAFEHEAEEQKWYTHYEKEHLGGITQ